MTGFDYAPAERVETVPEIVARAEEVSPVRGGVFVVAPDEAYTVELPLPRDGITITSQVTLLSADRIASEGLVAPGED